MGYLFGTAFHATARRAHVPPSGKGIGYCIHVNALLRSEADAVFPLFVLFQDNGYFHALNHESVVDCAIGITGAHRFGVEV